MNYCFPKVTFHKLLVSVWLQKIHPVGREMSPLMRLKSFTNYRKNKDLKYYRLFICLQAPPIPANSSLLMTSALCGSHTSSHMPAHTLSSQSHSWLPTPDSVSCLISTDAIHLWHFCLDLPLLRSYIYNTISIFKYRPFRDLISDISDFSVATSTISFT